jgi:CheY-like chemotaxis protein
VFGDTGRLAAQGVERQPVHEPHQFLGHRFKPFHQGLGFFQLTLSRPVFQIRCHAAGRGGKRRHHTAHDGLEAVGAAGVFRPDVVLLDIGLPKLNGYEAGRRIREQLGKDVMLIALTGWGQEEDRRRSKDAGFDHHMTKPVEFDALQKLLADLRTAH